LSKQEKNEKEEAVEPAENGSPVEEAVAEKSIEEKLADAETLAAEYLDGWQRERAEFANARKRLERQRQSAFSNAQMDVVRRLLDAMDDFERAIGETPDGVSENPWFEGLELVGKKLSAILTGMSVEIIEAVGQEFDPSVHEALAAEECDEQESGVVFEVVKKGYRIGERIVRPAQVKVAA